MKASLDWHLWVDCPKCKESIDLVDQNDDGVFAIPIFNNEWENLEGCEVYCPECKHEFEIDGVEY